MYTHTTVLHNTVDSYMYMYNYTCIVSVYRHVSAVVVHVVHVYMYLWCSFCSICVLECLARHMCYHAPSAVLTGRIADWICSSYMYMCV